MPEHDCLPSQVSAAEFLTHMAEVSGLPPEMARTRAADTLRHAGLFEERYRAIGGYSTGMKQRVKLCQALVHDPAFVFLDEPTAGLDPLGREEMLDADPEDPPRVRHQRAVLVAPDGRRRAHLRPHHRASGRPAGAVRRSRAVHEGNRDASSSRSIRTATGSSRRSSGAASWSRRRQRTHDRRSRRIGVRPRAGRARRGRRRRCAAWRRAAAR